MNDQSQVKRWIKPLPERVINKIAAGEVVERPAAVVKELVENAIDAGSTSIDITIEKSGAKLIKIVDNGCGISEEQIEIAFSRHATSKITNFDDLTALYTYGFRGEALPSIASVSRFRMVSRPPEQRSGTEIIYEGGVLQSKKPIASAIGTTIEVENLFFNTPARRKFLKAESTEARYLSRTSMALAISRPEIGFSLIQNGRKIFSLPSGQKLSERVASVLGAKRKFISIEGEHGPVKLTGSIGTPDAMQHNRNGQFIFVNGRYIQSPTISHAFAVGYGELLPPGRFPVGALRIEVEPSEVDVNVHPMKTEVRLSREREVHDSVYRIIKETLRQDGIIPLFKSNHTIPAQANTAPTRDKEHISQAIIPGVHSNKPLDPETMNKLYAVSDKVVSSPTSIDHTRADQPDGEIIVKVNSVTGEVIEESQSRGVTDGPSSGFVLIGRFSNLYLLIQAQDELYIVDQHTAHERVLYEKMLLKIDEQSVHAQSLLFPVQVELDPEQLSLYDEISDQLKESGFIVSEFGGRTVNIEGVPSLLSKKSPEKMFMKILDDIASLRKAGYDVKKAMAQSIACRSAVMSGDRLSDQEAVGLIASLLKCDNKYSCPHGRPTFIKLSREDIDRQFGRG